MRLPELSVRTLTSIGCLAAFELLAAAGSDHPTARVRPDPSVYAIVLASHYPDALPPVFIVQDTAISIRSVAGADPGWLRQFEGVPAPLQRAIDELGSAWLMRFEPSMFPPRTRLTGRKEIYAHFSKPLRDQWVTFPQMFGADRWHAFSAVLSTTDGRDALVYHEHYCGALCGEGAHVSLHRGSRDTHWVIRKRIIGWIA